MISVIIPLYNKEAYISETLHSVLSQTYDKFEVIVVDDGSTDNSLQVVRNFTDSRLRIVEKKNEGVSVARNEGIDQASFPWIAFLDADDWWAPTFLKEVVAAIENASSEKIFAIGRSRVFHKETERYNHPYLPANNSIGKVSYYQIISKYLPPINSSNVVISKSLLQNNRFQPGMRQHEDHDLWIRLCTNNDVVFINKPLSFYRKNVTNSASSNLYRAHDFKKYLESIRKVQEKLSLEEASYFRKYYIRFIMISFIQNYSSYTIAERKLVLSKIKPLVSKPIYVLLYLLHKTSFVDVFKLYKKIKR